MIHGAALLVAGLVLAGIGGELFVRGLVGVARWARIAPGIVALTLAAFATSSPELSVSINAALEGRPQIGLGDAIGSNVVNIALVFAIVLSLGPLTAGPGALRRDFPVAFLAPLITVFLAIDGETSRLDGCLMLALFLGWLAFALVEAWKQRSATKEILGEKRHSLVVPFCLAGFVFLVVAGRLIVYGGTSIGQAFGLNLFVVGATIVALGTSIPELATAVVAKLRGHGEVGLGTVLGSNIFNGLFIVSLAAIIHPIELQWQDVVTGLGFGALAVASIYPRKNRVIERQRSLLLIALYAAFVVALL